MKMGRRYGCQSMVTPLKSVLVKRPDEHIAVKDFTKWHYQGSPDLEEARCEHDAFVEILKEAGAEVLFHPEAQPGHADSIFTYDPAIVTEDGAVILRMGKLLRRGEEAPMKRRLEELDIPIHYTVSGEATVEGGDLLWLNEENLAVGQGFRTNAEGLRQIREAMRPLGVDVTPVELPYFGGLEACLHLMSLISFVESDLAVVYPPLLPVPFWKLLRGLGVTLLGVPEAEFNTMGTNVLALAPGKALIVEGNPLTEKLLRDAGCEVMTYRGVEISLKTEGGPTCLTRPILRLE
jgi:N-dimethylarginine dimethylaminohydrolase